MVYSEKAWKAKILENIGFEKEYLVTCITTGHPESEIKEYCDRLSRSLAELELIERTEEIHKNVGKK